MDSNTLNLALQLLAAGGQDIGSGNPLGANLNNAVMGNVAAKSQGMANQKMLQMLAQLMKDANDSTTAGKVSTDGKKFSYSTDLGSLDLGGIRTDESGMATFVPKSMGGSGIDWTKTPNPFQ